MAKVKQSRQMLLRRLDTIEKRVTMLAGADPSLRDLEVRIEQHRGERERAQARLAALDRKLEKIAEQRSDRSVEDSVAEHMNSRLASVIEEVESRLTRQPDTAAERFLSRVAKLESAVTEQHSAIVELRDFSIRNEQRMQKILNGMDSLISRNLTRGAR
ncbi:MAG: hypothetical protein KGN84_15530 [Acidobacteriota bacterium]|nr:hypothetical protein [Acidobacteriota bacterium]